MIGARITNEQDLSNEAFMLFIETREAVADEWDVDRTGYISPALLDGLSQEANRRIRDELLALRRKVQEMESRSRLTAEDASLLGKIASLGPEENQRLETHDIVFRRFPRNLQKEPPIGDEVWEALSFSLHTDVWEASTIAAGILADAEITKETK